jgi:hypothetical protein
LFEVVFDLLFVKSFCTEQVMISIVLKFTVWLETTRAFVFRFKLPTYNAFAAVLVWVFK